MPEESDPPQPAPEDPTLFGDVRPDELLARAMQPVRMSGDEGTWEPPTIAETAQLFPGYEVLKLLGRGGMGAVYQARQIELDRVVAIKLLPLEVSVNRSFADRFRREARAMAKLQHQNIVTVFDFGTTREGHLFFVMEYVEGANLADIIRKVGLNEEQALSVAGQVCTALAYAHDHGVVHRDIKPANVMIDTESHVKVADFGLARFMEPDWEQQPHTTTGRVMGTPYYMAPEQTKCMNVDHRADIYSLGVLLYEMLCREVPKGVFKPPSQRIGCDARIDAIVMTAMQQMPDHRYQSTEEMKTAVEAARTPLAPETPLPEPPSPPGTHGRWIGIGASLAAGLMVAGYLAPWPKSLAPRPAHRALEAVTPQPADSKVPTPPAGPTPLAPPSLNQAKIEPAPPATPIPAPPGPRTPGPSPRAAPPAPRASTPVAKPPSATGKWLAEQEPQWQAAFADEVTLPFEKALGALKKQYLAALDAPLAAATRSGRLNDSAALRAEHRLIEDGGDVPAADETASPAVVTTLRASYRKNLAVLEAQRMTKAAAVHARYEAILAQNQTLLTQRQRPDEALEIKVKREQLSSLWLKPSHPPLKRTSVVATRERPFVNSVGMKFVPLPVTAGPGGGQRVLISVWETRVQDYDAFFQAPETKCEWPKPPFPQGPTHPAVMTSYEDAVAFCAWLGRKEGRTYRLPTDAEWSLAAGLGKESGNSPQEKYIKSKDAGFPWGNVWPPPQGAGNYDPRWKVDEFVETAPAGSFSADRNGIHDLGGNIWEMCADWFDSEKKQRVHRGGAWNGEDESTLRSSYRGHAHPTSRNANRGFRCVLVVPGD